jgi:hypothetical protein
MENPKPRSCDPPGLFSKRATAMNNSDLDQADEEILTYAVSDEALEAAAGTESGCMSVQDDRRPNHLPPKLNLPACRS